MRLCALGVNQLRDLRGVPIFLGRGNFRRVTLTEIMRSLEPLNESRDADTGSPTTSLWNHCQRHYSFAGKWPTGQAA